MGWQERTSCSASAEISRVDIEQIKFRNPLIEVVARYAGAPRRVGIRPFWICSFHQENTPSFTLTPDGDQFFCFGCGITGDVIAFIMKVERCGFSKAIAILNRAESAISNSRSRKSTRQESLRWSGRAEATWGSCIQLPGTLGAIYLSNRGCALPGSGEVRFKTNLRHWPTGTSWPALISRVTDFLTAEPLTLHFTFLAADGAGKAPVERPRLLLPGHVKRRGVVRLVDDAEVALGLGIAEGIETSLCVSAAGWSPLWAAIDAGNLASLPVIPGLESLTIFGDADCAGLKAARTLAERWAAAGREARICAPPTQGHDWNDRLGGL